MSDASGRTAMARPPVAVITLLGVLAGLSVAAGLVGAMLLLVLDQQAGQVSARGIALSVAALLGGVALGCLFWGLAHLIRRQGRATLLQASAARTIEQRPAGEMPMPPPAGGAIGPAGGAPLPSPGLDAPAPPPVSLSVAAGLYTPPAPPVPAADAPRRGAETVEQRLLREILAQLRELNENVLLSAEQRQARRELRLEKLSRRFRERIEAAIEAGDFPAAEKHLEDFREQVPADAHHAPLHARLAEARQAARREDIEAHSRQVVDLMAVSSFDQAERVAQELHARHLEEPAPAELLERVRREAAAFTKERRDRMYRQVERHAESRQWRQALKAAREFVDAFPDGPSADAIRAMLATMEENARIESVRELRDHIRDLIERRRYAEAAETAEEVIRRYPDLRASAELRRQLPRLRELARAPANHGQPRT